MAGGTEWDISPPPRHSKGAPMTFRTPHLHFLGVFSAFVGLTASGCAADVAGANDDAVSTGQALGTDGNCHPGIQKAASASSTVRGDTAALAIDGVGPGAGWIATSAGVATLN